MAWRPWEEEEEQKPQQQQAQAPTAQPQQQAPAPKIGGWRPWEDGEQQQAAPAKQGTGTWRPWEDGGQQQTPAQPAKQQPYKPLYDPANDETNQSLPWYIQGAQNAVSETLQLPGKAVQTLIREPAAYWSGLMQGGHKAGMKEMADVGQGQLGRRDFQQQGLDAVSSGPAQTAMDALTAAGKHGVARPIGAAVATGRALFDEDKSEPFLARAGEHLEKMNVPEWESAGAPVREAADWLEPKLLEKFHDSPNLYAALDTVMRGTALAADIGYDPATWTGMGLVTRLGKTKNALRSMAQTAEGVTFDSKAMRFIDTATGKATNADDFVEALYQKNRKALEDATDKKVRQQLMREGVSLDKYKKHAQQLVKTAESKTKPAWWEKIDEATPENKELSTLGKLAEGEIGTLTIGGHDVLPIGKKVAEGVIETGRKYGADLGHLTPEQVLKREGQNLGRLKGAAQIGALVDEAKKGADMPLDLLKREGLDEAQYKRAIQEGVQEATGEGAGARKLYAAEFESTPIQRSDAGLFGKAEQPDLAGQTTAAERQRIKQVFDETPTGANPLGFETNAKINLDVKVKPENMAKVQAEAHDYFSKIIPDDAENIGVRIHVTDDLGAGGTYARYGVYDTSGDEAVLLYKREFSIIDKNEEGYAEIVLGKIENMAGPERLRQVAPKLYSREDGAWAAVAGDDARLYTVIQNPKTEEAFKAQYDLISEEKTGEIIKIKHKDGSVTEYEERILRGKRRPGRARQRQQWADDGYTAGGAQSAEKDTGWIGQRPAPMDDAGLAGKAGDPSRPPGDTAGGGNVRRLDTPDGNDGGGANAPRAGRVTEVPIRRRFSNADLQADYEQRVRERIGQSRELLRTEQEAGVIGEGLQTRFTPEAEEAIQKLATERATREVKKTIPDRVAYVFAGRIKPADLNPSDKLLYDKARQSIAKMTDEMAEEARRDLRTLYDEPLQANAEKQFQDILPGVERLYEKEVGYTPRVLERGPEQPLGRRIMDWARGKGQNEHAIQRKVGGTIDEAEDQMARDLLPGEQEKVADLQKRIDHLRGKDPERWSRMIDKYQKQIDEVYEKAKPKFTRDPYQAMAVRRINHEQTMAARKAIEHIRNEPTLSHIPKGEAEIADLHSRGWVPLKDVVNTEAGWAEGVAAIAAKENAMVAPEVANILKTQGRIFADPKKAADKWADVMKMYDRLNGGWKGWLLSTPGWVARNVYGESHANFMNGVWHARDYEDAGHIMRSLRKGEKPMAIRTEVGVEYSPDQVEDFVRAVSGRGPQAMAQSKPGELFKNLDQFKGKTPTQKILGAIRDFGRIDPEKNTYASAILRMGQAVDNEFRIAQLLHELRNNHLRPDEAMQRVFKTHGNYMQDGLYGDVARNVGRAVPFVRWMMHNIPFQMKMMVQNPGRWALPAKIADNFANEDIDTAALPDHLRSSWPIEQRTVPVKDQKSGFTFDHEVVDTIPLERMWPAFDLDVLARGGTEPLGLNPFANTYMQSLTGKNTFGHPVEGKMGKFWGMAIPKEYETLLYSIPHMRNLEILLHPYISGGKQTPGVGGFTKQGLNNPHGWTDRFLRMVLGIRTYAVDLTRRDESLGYEIQRKENEIIRDFERAMRDAATEEAKQAVVEHHMARLDELERTLIPEQEAVQRQIDKGSVPQGSVVP